MNELKPKENTERMNWIFSSLERHFSWFFYLGGKPVVGMLKYLFLWTPNDAIRLTGLMAIFSSSAIKI